MSKYSTICLIVAAGNGRRSGLDKPKQYYHLAGKPLLRFSAETFASHPNIDAVRIIYNPYYQDEYDKALSDLNLLSPVPGGNRRQDSVRLGLESIQEYSPHHVLIHDAARPFVDHGTITRTLNALKTHRGSLPALPVTDTLKFCDGDIILHTTPRDNLYRAQTPQAFDYLTILNAHRQLQAETFTDDTAMLEKLGIDVKIVQGTEINHKITTHEDMMKAEQQLTANTETRTGFGFDVHRFGPAVSNKGNSITLCGIKVPHEKSLVGHSDADVGIHAIVDALLGAIGAGDIGYHFPPSDDSFKNMDSKIFLSKARDFIYEKKGSIINIDITIIGERPKIGPHRDAMQLLLSEILKIAPSRINIKATTTEKLGFTGRGEGLAAQAIANVNLHSLSCW